ncbi:hypothetical protein V3H18_00435 [Methylocystis sp. 9N]|uniref:DUF3108 domain-containing protein n=1 Tax=Methylocystis borbori TaxID=3118750 RepID=A0ABU7XC82_9HYPH
MIHLRHRVLCTLLLLIAGWTSAASASECQRADASLAGHYYLRGVMEVGSELQLQANGKFDYMLAYGALDELASGCWSREGQTVTLVVSKFKANTEDPMKFERLVLEIKPDGKLIRRFDGGDTGAYSR